MEASGSDLKSFSGQQDCNMIGYKAVGQASQTLCPQAPGSPQGAYELPAVHILKIANESSAEHFSKKKKKVFCFCFVFFLLV